MNISTASKPSIKTLPGKLERGQTFRCRQTTNSRRWTVNGLVLKICPENGFKPGSYHSEHHGMIRVPVDDQRQELILNPDVEVYLL